MNAILDADTYVFDGEKIARLTPIPAFDPAVLWPASDGMTCGVHAPDRPLTCTLAPHQGGMHAAHTDLGEPPVYVWGDPR